MYWSVLWNECAWNMIWMTDANQRISMNQRIFMICNFDETDILFVCFGIMDRLAAVRLQQDTAKRHGDGVGVTIG